MESQGVQGICLEDVLSEDLKSKTVEIPLTKHLLLRITPDDWASGTLLLGESLFVKKEEVESLKQKIGAAIK